MNIILLRALFFILILSGIFILLKVVPVLVKMIREKPVLSLPLTQAHATFAISIPGTYSIWQKSRSMLQTKTEMALPAVFPAGTDRRLPLNHTRAMITANDGSGTRRQLYTVLIPSAGEYRLELRLDTGRWEGGSRKDAEKFSMEIRKPMPVFTLVLCVLGLLVAAFCIFGGIACLAMPARLFSTP